MNHSIHSSQECAPVWFPSPIQSPMSSSHPQGSDQLIGLPITPPATEADPKQDKILFTAVQVLSTEATALSHLSRLYATDPLARDGFVRSVEGITHSLNRGGKVVVVGVGKSGKIGQKLVATMNSLGLLSVFLHPVEALHGDLGILRPSDILLLITFSGNTPELLTLLPHFPAHIPVIALTSHMSYHTSKLTSSRSNTILLPAPIPESEESSFGLSAPTTSTTVAMALGDALALAVARTIHVEEDRGPKEVFKRNHPGGAIGLNIGKISMKMSDLAVSMKNIPLINEDYSMLDTPPSSASSTSSSCGSESDGGWASELRVLDCLLAAVRAPKGWLKVSDDEVIPPRRLQRVRNPQLNVRDPELDLVVSQRQWIKVSGDASVAEIRRLIIASRADSAEMPVCISDGTVIGVVVENRIIGVIEAGDVFESR